MGQWHQVGPFPFLFGGTFIEGGRWYVDDTPSRTFPFLFGGTFIEGAPIGGAGWNGRRISLPFRRDFH